MKKLLFFIIVLTFVFVGCDKSEIDDYSNEEVQVEQLKLRIREIANDYGLYNIEINEEKLYSYLHITDEEIENDMRKLSMIKGLYNTKSVKDGSVLISAKKNKRQATRSVESYVTSTTITSSLPNLYGLRLEGTLKFKYDRDDISSFTADFVIYDEEVYDENDFGNVVDEDYSGVIEVTTSGLSCNVVGAMDDLVFNFSGSFRFEYRYVSYTYAFTGTHDRGATTFNCTSSSN